LNILQIIREMRLITGVFLNKPQSKLLALQKLNVISTPESSPKASPSHKESYKKVKMREDSILGTLGEFRECLDYFKHKPTLNVIDKRLLLGVFQRHVEISDHVETRQSSSVDDSRYRSRLIDSLVEGNTWSPRKGDTPRFKQASSPSRYDENPGFSLRLKPTVEAVGMRELKVVTHEGVKVDEVMVAIDPISRRGRRRSNRYM
jgi:hypothetical protein